MRGHRAHDYAFLVRRWLAVARKARLKLEEFARVDGHGLYCLRSPALGGRGGLYLSAGIHGDEPGATEGLIAWAEADPARLRELPVLIFPCLNPWGLIQNSRLTSSGADLNRFFHRDDHPVIRALKDRVGECRFALALLLHEDFDAQGLYLYELKRARPDWGETMLEAASGILPVDPRKTIDGHRARHGVIRRRFQARRFAEIGFPEAIWLHRHHAERSLTIETPSEFALAERIRAHVAVLEHAAACVARGA